MVLTKEELIGSLQHEVRVLVHLAGKVDKSKLDYRPTPKQRSILELLQYMAIMGPLQVALIKAGTFNREAMVDAWNPAEAAAKAMSFDQAVAAIQSQSDEYAGLLSGWTEADFRSEVDMFGNKTTRGSMLVNLVLSAHAAYRTQLFCYLKSSGREELNTMNLWMGIDGSMASA
jgi:hypothetical protein